MVMGCQKWVDSNSAMLEMEAPISLRMPISLVRCSAVKVVKPNKPKQEMKMAKKAK